MIFKDLETQVKRLRGEDGDDDDDGIESKYDIEPKIGGYSLRKLPWEMNLGNYPEKWGLN